jgi:SAM-dependent methyltransferase
MARWRRGLSPVDLWLDSQCRGRVLEVGCGPGRLISAVGPLGLGVDSSPLAVAEVHARGGRAVCQSIFEPLPDESRYGTLIVADGSVGIGGDPIRLFVRLGQLLSPSGTAWVEFEEPNTTTRIDRIRIRSPRGDTSAWFDWSVISISDLWLVELAGLRAGPPISCDGRHFAALSRP